MYQVPAGFTIILAVQIQPFIVTQAANQCTSVLEGGLWFSVLVLGNCRLCDQACHNGNDGRSAGVDVWMVEAIAENAFMEAKLGRPLLLPPQRSQSP